MWWLGYIFVFIYITVLLGLILFEDGNLWRGIVYKQQDVFSWKKISNKFVNKIDIS